MSLLPPDDPPPSSPSLLRQVTDYNQITHVIFDMDGLLIDTERLYTELTQRIVGRYDKTFTWELKARMMGKRQPEAAAVLIEALELPMTVDEWLREARALQEELFPTAQLMPGAERLVRHLVDHNVHVAVATSSHRDMFELKTQRHGELFALFDVIVTGDDPEVENGKPAPDIFDVAAARMPNAPTPDTVLVFEDAPNGVAAARAADMSVVMVPDPNLDRGLCTLASDVIDSLEAFDPARWQLPPFLE